MSRFGECFFLIFGQLAVGGALGLAVPEFRGLERGFYKSSAGIFVFFALVFVVARALLLGRGEGFDRTTCLELALWVAFTLAFSIYLASLWGDAGKPRARAFASTVLLGLAALGSSALAYRPAALDTVPWLLYAAPLFTGAGLLGGVATGMLLGHWYLIDLGLSIDPLRRMHRFFVRATLFHLLALLVVPLLVWASSQAGAQAVAVLLGEQRPLFAIRLLLGPLPTLAIAWLIHRTLQIPQTMAATGLFYVAVLVAMVGEMVGRLVLFRTGLPL